MLKQVQHDKDATLFVKLNLTLICQSEFISDSNFLDAETSSA